MSDAKHYLESNWHHLKGFIVQKWGKFTDDELQESAGKHEKLVALFQKHYDLSYDQAEKELESFGNQHYKKD